MHIFLDTEFNEFGGELISVGMVKHSGEEFYLELPRLEKYGPWVTKNVVPLLEGGDKIFEKPYAQVALQKFFSDVEWPSIIVDHPADIKYFCELIDLNYGNYIGPKRGWQFTVIPDLKYVSKTPHHALADARALREAYIAERHAPWHTLS